MWKHSRPTYLPHMWQSHALCRHVPADGHCTPNLVQQVPLSTPTTYSAQGTGVLQTVWLQWTAPLLDQTGDGCPPSTDDLLLGKHINYAPLQHLGMIHSHEQQGSGESARGNQSHQPSDSVAASGKLASNTITSLDMHISLLP